MKKIGAGSPAKAGYYYNPRTWSIHPVPADGERLPGEKGQSWIALPTLAALVLSPLLGLAFVIFLPFIGLYLTIAAFLRPVARMFKHQATELAATMSPGWQPGEAHLTGKRHDEAVEGKGQSRDGLETLANEIETKRQEKKS